MKTLTKRQINLWLNEVEADNAKAEEVIPHWNTKKEQL